MLPRSPRWIVSLGISLLGHAVVVLLLVVVPWRQTLPTRVVAPPTGKGLSIQLVTRGSLSSLKKSPSAHADEEEWNPTFNPELPGTKQAPSPEFPVNIAAAVAAPSSPSRPSASSGTGNSGGTGSLPAGRPTQLKVSKGVQRVVYLLDRSISMGPTGALERGREEVLSSLRSLPSGTRVQIIPYNRAALPLLAGEGGYAVASATLCESAEQALNDIPAAGATDHIEALRRGLSLRPDVLFLITDSGDLKSADILGITRMNQGRTAIHVVELSPFARRGSSLARLAEQNAGQHRTIDPR